MKKMLLAGLVFFCLMQCMAQPKQAASLRTVLLEQLRSTHNQKDWFVPIDTAIAGLPVEKANWHDSSGNHSVAQLVSHLIFWNTQQLAKMKGQQPPAFDGNNNGTFVSLDAAGWLRAIQQLDDVLTQLENLVAKSDEAFLQKWCSNIANISTHNAYHTGQVIFVRKQQGSWDPEKGVK